uniref:Glycoprotein 1 n=1 Tax=Madalivirus amazonaense TaxID=2956148 RepID=A0AB38ZNL9_9MONO
MGPSEHKKVKKIPAKPLTNKHYSDLKHIPITIEGAVFPKEGDIDEEYIVKLWVYAYAIRKLKKDVPHPNVFTFLHKIKFVPEYKPAPLDDIKAYISGFLARGNHLVAAFFGDVADEKVPFLTALKRQGDKLFKGYIVDWKKFCEPTDEEFKEWFKEEDGTVAACIYQFKTTTEIAEAGMIGRFTAESDLLDYNNQTFIDPMGDDILNDTEEEDSSGTINLEKDDKQKEDLAPAQKIYPPLESANYDEAPCSSKSAPKPNIRQAKRDTYRQEPGSGHQQPDMMYALEGYLSHVRNLIGSYSFDFFSDAVIYNFSIAKSYCVGNVLYVRPEEFRKDPAIILTELADFAMNAIKNTGYYSKKDFSPEMLDMKAIRASVDEIRRIPTMMQHKIDLVNKNTEQILQIMKSGVMAPVKQLNQALLSTVLPVDKPLRDEPIDTQSIYSTDAPSSVVFYDEPYTG